MRIFSQAKCREFLLLFQQGKVRLLFAEETWGSSCMWRNGYSNSHTHTWELPSVITALHCSSTKGSSFTFTMRPIQIGLFFWAARFKAATNKDFNDQLICQFSQLIIWSVDHLIEKCPSPFPEAKINVIKLSALFRVGVMAFLSLLTNKLID